MEQEHMITFSKPISEVVTQNPVIVSASRSTDIPAFYCDWFFHRLETGFSAWINPYNKQRTYISYDDTRFIVFWSKNPRPLLDYLPKLNERGIGCYVQYTVNDYEKEGLERNVSPLAERIDTFKRLVEVLGFGGVIWRFDPLMLTDTIGIDELLSKIENIGDQLVNFTEKLVFSFADIAVYKKVKTNLETNGVKYREWTEELMQEFATRLVDLNNRKKWGFVLATCGEKGRYEGVVPNHCIDDELIIQRCYTDKKLMDYLKVEIKPIDNLFGGIPEGAVDLCNGYYAVHGNNKDKGQRALCGCAKSKDIGQYNTCIHACEYCYANASKELALQNYQKHLVRPNYETINGE